MWTDENMLIITFTLQGLDAFTLHSGPKEIKLKHKSTLDTFDTPMSFLWPKIVTAVKHHICSASFGESSMLVTQGHFKRLNHHSSRARKRGLPVFHS